MFEGTADPGFYQPAIRPRQEGSGGCSEWIDPELLKWVSDVDLISTKIRQAKKLAAVPAQANSDLIQRRRFIADK